MPAVELRGPLFKKSKQVVASVTKQFIQYAIELGEQRLDEQARPGPAGEFLSRAEARPGQASTGNYRRNIGGKATSNTTGFISDGGIVYGSWLEGTSSRNQASQFKGYALFRKTSTWLQKEVYTRKKQWEREYARKLNGF